MVTICGYCGLWYGEQQQQQHEWNTDFRESTHEKLKEGNYNFFFPRWAQQTDKKELKWLDKQNNN